MSDFRTWLQTAFAIALVLSIVPSGRSQTNVPPVIFTGPLSQSDPNGYMDSSWRHFRVDAPPLCTVHPLGDLGDDPKLCKWIADTIPEMIQPSTWKLGHGRIVYYAPAKIPIVTNTPAVHAQVDEFLKGIKRSLPAQKKSTPQSEQIVPVQAIATGSLRMPKHLFHFIIRYEGAGIVDANLAKFAKFKSVPFPLLINQYSSDPMVRMEQMMIDSENLRNLHDEWRQFWMNDQPSHLTPYRIHGGVGPSSSSP